MAFSAIGGPSKTVLASILVFCIVIGYGSASTQDDVAEDSVDFPNPPDFKKYTVTEGKYFSTRCFTTSLTAYWTNKKDYRKKGAWLIFGRISREDAGLYYCYKHNDYLIQSVFIDVQYPAKITNITKEPEPVNKKGTFCITLEVEGNPKPTTTLVSDETGKSVFAQCAAGTVSIKYGPVKCSDSGTYTLTARNEIGSDVLGEELLVYCPPSPNGNIKDRFTPRLKDSVTMEINAIGYPEPTYTWEFDGEVLQNDTQGKSDEYEIEKVKIGDFGVYTVTMKNKFGSCQQQYNVKPYGPPDPATQLSVDKTSVNSTEISFKSGYNYENCQNFIVENCDRKSCTKICSFADDSKNNRPSQVSHVLTGLASGTVYNLSVVSNNTCGQSRSEPITFKTDYQKRFTVTEGKSFHTRCLTLSITAYWTDKKSFSRRGAWLTFWRISREDAGFYYCYKYKDNLVETIYIDVQYAAKITNITNDPAPVNKKGTFCLNLEVEGNPKPTTTLVSVETGKTVFSQCAVGSVAINYGPVKCSDSGRYTLTTKNAIGCDVIKKDLFVNCPPSQKGNITHWFIPRLGDNVNLEIDTIGYPEPSFTWIFDGEVLKNDTVGSQDEYEIEDVKISDFGKYTVKMQNKFGSDIQNYYVKPFGPPDAATNLFVNTTALNVTTLSFVSGYDYETCQTFTVENCDCNSCTELASVKDDPKSHRPCSVSVVLTGLEQGTRYNVSVVSNNTFGESRSESIRFKTDYQKEYTVTEGKLFSIRCPTLSLTAFWTDNKSYKKLGARLTFLKISREDAGYYYCYSHVNNLIETVYIDVQYAAKITNISNVPQTIKEDGTICLNVEVEGNPVPTTTLVSDNTGKTVFTKTADGKVTFQTGKIKCRDTGKYTLTTRNSIGSDNTERNLYVLCPPSPDGKVKTNFTPRLGENVNMKISSIGYPEPTYVWTFDGEVLQNDTQGNEDKYKLEDVRVKDYGVYTVKMSNEYGSSSVCYNVKPDGPPAPARKLAVSNTTEYTTVLSFKPGYDYDNCQNFIVEDCNRDACVELANFKCDCTNKKPKTVSYTITDLVPFTSYNLSVVSNNTDGQTRSSSYAMFETEPRTYRVAEGEQLYARCFINSPFAYWTNKKLFYRKGTILYFESISRKNAGYYYCYKGPTALELKIKIDVLYQAKITVLPKHPDPVRQNSTVTLTFEVEGNPTPTTTLISGNTGKPVFSKCANGKITFESGPIRCKDSGNYTLITKNDVGDDKTDGQLLVYCKPCASDKVKTKFTPRLGENVNLQIASTGYPDPTYTWEFDGKVLKNGSEASEDTYRIKKMKIKDFGVYTVTMTNQLGSSSQQYSVTADGPPEPVSELDVKKISGNSSVLTFTSGYDYEHWQHFKVEAYNGDSYDELLDFEPKSRQHNPTSVSQKINNLEPGTTYNISVVSENDRGQQRSSAFVVFTTSVVTHSNFEVIEGENMTLTCDSSDLNGTKVTDLMWEDAEGNELSATKVLAIEAIDRTQSGYYKCFGKTEFTSKMLVQDYFVDVQYPASFINQTVDDNYLNVNETYVLELHVEGNPAPTVSFIKTRDGSVEFTETGNGFFNITMDPVKCSDMGFYNLTCENKVGGETKKKNIYVYCPPMLDMRAKIKKVLYPRIGSIASLLIRNYGYPFPKYNWTYNRQKVLPHSDNNYESVADVEITPNDFGNYFVDMQNEFGLMDYSFEIIADGPPDPVTDLNITDVTDTSAKLSWIPGYDYGKQQTFNIMMSKDGNYISVANVTQEVEIKLENKKLLGANEKRMEYTLTGLEGALEYNFTVQSMNANGTSTMPEKPAVFNTEQPNPSSQTGDDVDEGAVIGGVLGGVAFLAIIAVVGVFLMKRRSRRAYDSLT